MKTLLIRQYSSNKSDDIDYVSSLLEKDHRRPSFDSSELSLFLERNNGYNCKMSFEKSTLTNGDYDKSLIAIMPSSIRIIYDDYDDTLIGDKVLLPMLNNIEVTNLYYHDAFILEVATAEDRKLFDIMNDSDSVCWHRNPSNGKFNQITKKQIGKCIVKAKELVNFVSIEFPASMGNFKFDGRFSINVPGKNLQMFTLNIIDWNNNENHSGCRYELTDYDGNTHQSDDDGLLYFNKMSFHGVHLTDENNKYIGFFKLDVIS